MKADEIRQILVTHSFIVRGTDLKYRFTDNTISLNNSLMTRYNLYEEDEKVYLKTEPHLFVNEDCLITYSNKTYPPVMTISPKSGASQIVYLEVLQP